MAQREAALWRFAVDRVERFFRDLFDALDEYFGVKTEAALAQLEADARWYSGLRDTAKQSGVLVNKGFEWLGRGAGYARKRLDEANDPRTAPLKTALDIARELLRSGENVIDTRDIVRRALDTQLAPADVADYVARIVAAAATRYEEAWVAEIKAQTPDLASLSAFRSVASPGFTPSAAVAIGPAEGFLAVGLGSALAGTFSLAAGWHTLAYAMVHVFYPVAILVAMATVGVAILDQERSLERRRSKVRDAVNAYHRQLLLTLDAGQFAELGGRSLRQWLADQTKALVIATVQRWQQAISGRLTTEHYRKLGTACEVHLRLIGECFDRLNEPDGARAVIEEQPAGPSEALSRSR